MNIFSSMKKHLKNLSVFVFSFLALLIFNTPLNASADSINISSVTANPVPSLTIAIQVSNSQYVSADSPGNILANAKEIQDNQKFELIPTGELNTYVLKAKSNSKYVSFEPNGKIIANQSAIGPWQKIEAIPTGEPHMYTIKAKSNGKYVSAVNGGGQELPANGITVTDWEKFMIITL